MRERLAARFEGVPWATIDVSIGARWSEESVAAYYAETARHKFALSPEGLGSDCYRHWEALYLGTIPIVEADTTTRAFSDLPILFTEDYSEVDRPYLEARWRRFGERRFDFGQLRKSHYRERFRSSVAELSSPRFLCWGFRGTAEEVVLERLGADS